jgi:hypothetical protein
MMGEKIDRLTIDNKLFHLELRFLDKKYDNSSMIASIKFETVVIKSSSEISNSIK